MDPDLDPAPDPDPAIVVSRFQVVDKNSKFFYFLIFVGTSTSVFEDKKS